MLIKTFKGFKAYLFRRGLPQLPMSYEALAKGIIENKLTRETFLKHSQRGSFLYPLIRAYLKEV